MKVEAYKDSRGKLHEKQEQQLKADSKYSLEDYMDHNPIYGYTNESSIDFNNLDLWLYGERVTLLKDYLDWVGEME